VARYGLISGLADVVFFINGRRKISTSFPAIIPAIFPSFFCALGRLPQAIPGASALPILALGY